MSLLSVSFSYSGTQEEQDTVKFIEFICFANFAVFHVYLTQIYFESKHSKKF